MCKWEIQNAWDNSCFIVCKRTNCNDENLFGMKERNLIKWICFHPYRVAWIFLLVHFSLRFKYFDRNFAENFFSIFDGETENNGVFFLVRTSPTLDYVQSSERWTQPFFALFIQRNAHIVTLHRSYISLESFYVKSRFFSVSKLKHSVGGWKKGWNQVLRDARGKIHGL